MPQLDPLEIIAKVEGEAEIRRLEQEIEKATRSIENLSSQMSGAGANAANLKNQMEAAATSIANNSSRVEELKTKFGLLEGSSHHLGRGLLQTAYVIDDLQYGFKAILNNIPQLVMGLGGSAGLAGAIGILAIALSKVEIDWARFTEGLIDTRGLEGVKSWTEHLADLTDNLINANQAVNQPGVLGLFEKARDWFRYMGGAAGMEPIMKREEERRGKLIAAGEGASDMKTSAQTAMASLFHETLKEYTQSRLIGEYVKKEVERLQSEGRQLTGSQIEEIRQQGLEQIGMGLRGRLTSMQAGGVFGRSFQQAMDEQKNMLMDRAMKEDKASIDKKAHEEEKREQERYRREKAEDEAEAKGAQEAFEEDKLDKRHRLQARIKAMQHLYEENAEAIRRMGRSETLTGEEYASRVTQAGFDSIPNQQLQTQKEIKLAIDKLHDKLSKVNEMRFKKE